MANTLEAARLIGSALGRSPSRSLASPLALLGLTMLLLVPDAAGQSVASNFKELGFKVKAGDTIFVTDGGAPEREARILELTGSLLAVSIDGARRELAERDVSRIRQRLPDSRKNGALIGFLVGAATSTGGAIAMASPAGSCSGGCVATNILVGGGVGGLVGMGIDALIQGRKDIYVRAQASRSIEVAPLMLSQAKGVSVSLEF